MTSASVEFAGLKARIVGEGGPLVVLLHGFGAPGTDLVPLAHALSPGRRYVFPEAPLALPAMYGPGRAWWMLDMERLQRAMMSGVPRDLSEEYPEGLPEVREMLVAFLRELDPKGDQPMVLGGFSQGAMLSCDVALHADRPLAGLVLLSGSLVARDWWLPRVATRSGLPVFQSHGRQDSVLGFGGAESLRDALSAGGLNVDFHEFRGGHEIPMPILRGVDAFLDATLSGHPNGS